MFAFYRHTCRALRIHISREIERRIMLAGQRQLREAGREGGEKEVERLLERTQRRYFDDTDSPGRRAVDKALIEIMQARAKVLEAAQVSDKQREALMDVMRRFLRVETTLVRCFPLAMLDSVKPAEAVGRMLDFADGSDMSWRMKFDGFIEFLSTKCSTEERRLFLDAALETRTGRIRVDKE